MKYVDEYRDPALARHLFAEIEAVTLKTWTLMEVCGGQTHTIVRQGIDELVPAGVRMIHGPGRPVCVTPLELIDKALAIARRDEVIFTSYGDMLRVPGTATDLLALRAGAPTSAWSIHRSTRSVSPRIVPTARWCSSPSASRPPRRPTPWRCWAHQLGLPNFSCWSATYWCRPR